MHERRCYVNNDNVAYFKHDLEVATTQEERSKKNPETSTNTHVHSTHAYNQCVMDSPQRIYSLNVDDVIRQMNKILCKIYYNVPHPTSTVNDTGMRGEVPKEVTAYFFIAHYLCC